jgi:bacteriocin biosynthesis cyclodehydratase domain-containing protein
MAAPAMTAPPAERRALRLADGCWVGRSGGTVLMAVGGEYFAAESPAAADAIEERLRTAGPGDVDPASEALVALGLLTAEPPGPAVTGGQLAGAVLGLLRERGLHCAAAGGDGAPGRGRRRPLAGLLDFATAPVPAARSAAAVSAAARAAVPLVTVLRIGNELAVTPAMAPGGRGCGHCLWLRHLATLPRPAAATLAPGHRVLAESLGGWPARLAPALAGLLADAVAAALGGPPAGVTRISAAALSATRHALLPRPDCPACGGGPAPGPAAAGGDPAVDPWCGLVTSVTADEPVPGLHNAIAAGALPLRSDGTPAAPAADLSRGLGPDRGAARARARGEALERYAARSPGLEDARLSLPPGAQSITLAELWPETAPGGAPAGRDPRPASAPGGAAGWARATWLDGGSVWVPRAAMVIGGGMAAGAAQVTSNGVAADPSAARARSRAVAELLERDAILTTWVHRRPARRLPVTGELVASLADALRAAGVQASLWRLDSAAAVPVVMAVGRGDGTGNLALTLGAACDTTTELASVRAMSELAGNVLSTAQEIRDGALAPIPAEAVRHIDDHAAYYLSPAAGGALDFLSRPGGQAMAPGPPGPPAGGPHDVIPACLAAGLRIATCDITPADVAACGLRVVRAVSPDLAPLWFGWHREPAGHPRLRCPRPNRAPHPFR